MYYEQIDCELKETYFAFFHRFSRFEFCLKKYVPVEKETNPLNKYWERFVCEFSECYTISTAANELLADPPNKQRFENGNFNWNPVCTETCYSELDKVVLLLKTVRNNLFHGDKQGDIDRGSVQRNLNLLCIGIRVLDDLADLADSKFCDFLDNYKITIKQ